MMTVDILFQFAKVYNIDRVDVVKGQKFKLLSTFENGKWFSDEDTVLTLKVSKGNAEVTADNEGQSTILIMSDSHTIVKELLITVINDPADMATNLNPSADTPVSKSEGQKGATSLGVKKEK